MRCKNSFGIRFIVHRICLHNLLITIGQSRGYCAQYPELRSDPHHTKTPGLLSNHYNIKSGTSCRGPLLLAWWLRLSFLCLASDGRVSVGLASIVWLWRQVWSCSSFVSQVVQVCVEAAEYSAEAGSPPMYTPPWAARILSCNSIVDGNTTAAGRKRLGEMINWIKEE